MKDCRITINGHHVGVCLTRQFDGGVVTLGVSCLLGTDLRALLRVR